MTARKRASSSGASQRVRALLASRCFTSRARFPCTLPFSVPSRYTREISARQRFTVAGAQMFSPVACSRWLKLLRRYGVGGANQVTPIATLVRLRECQRIVRELRKAHHRSAKIFRQLLPLERLRLAFCCPSPVSSRFVRQSHAAIGMTAGTPDSHGDSSDISEYLQLWRLIRLLRRVRSLRFQDMHPKSHGEFILDCSWLCNGK